MRLRSGAVAERSYPLSEVRGGSQEELPRIQGQQRPGEATLRPRSRAARRRCPVAEVTGCREKPPRPKAGGVTLRSHPEPEARGGSWEEPPMPEARAGSREEQPKQWWLRRHRRA